MKKVLGGASVLGLAAVLSMVPQSLMAGTSDKDHPTQSTTQHTGKHKGKKHTGGQNGQTPHKGKTQSTPTNPGN